MTYKSFLESRIQNYDFGMPIYTSVLAHDMMDEFSLSMKDASAAVSVAIKRIMDCGEVRELHFYQKGIYYRAKMTPFGETGINREALIADKYLADNNGYETGLSLLHRMGLTTQIPSERVIATNNATNCIRKNKTLGISICPPKIKIDENNKFYLQVLDAIDTMENAPVDAEHPYRLIALHIKKLQLDYKELLSLAGKYYNRNAVLTLAKIAGEEY